MGHQEDIEKTESKIIIIRDTQVILDRDVAELYGVETRDINKAVKNNPKKFPPGYIIELNSSEKQELVENFHRFNTLKHSTVAPHAFTEQGLYMLATILKGDLAISTTIAIIDTFTQLRKLAEIGDLRKLSREELELYDEDIKNMRDIYITRRLSNISGAAFLYAFTLCKSMKIVLSLLHVFKIFMIIFFNRQWDGFLHLLVEFAFFVFYER